MDGSRQWGSVPVDVRTAMAQTVGESVLSHPKGNALQIAPFLQPLKALGLTSAGRKACLWEVLTSWGDGHDITCGCATCLWSPHGSPRPITSQELVGAHQTPCFSSGQLMLLYNTFLLSMYTIYQGLVEVIPDHHTKASERATTISDTGNNSDSRIHLYE
jgi:hypothetical protein